MIVKSECFIVYMLLPIKLSYIYIFFFFFLIDLFEHTLHFANFRKIIHPLYKDLRNYLSVKGLTNNPGQINANSFFNN